MTIHRAGVISRRVSTVVSEISGHTLADIGTDHGYIAIEALRAGRVSRAILCDINKGPLGRASENVSAAGLFACAQTRLGNGLSPLRPGEADCISIAGMGGMLMIEIMRAGADVLGAAQRLVLQPQLDIDAVRRFVHSEGFVIAQEHMLYEKKFYTVIRCERGGEVYTDVEYAFGKILLARKDAVLKEYLAWRIAQCERICREHKSTDVEKERIQCEEVLSWL